MFRGVIAGIAGLSVTLTRLAGKMLTVDDSPVVIANLNLSMYPFSCWISGSFNL